MTTAEAENVLLVDYLPILYAIRAPETEVKCASFLCVGRELGQYFRCDDCSGPGRFVCRLCLLRAHTNLPFHRIKKWTGEMSEEASLLAKGFVMELGHNDGPPCQTRANGVLPTMKIMHTNNSGGPAVVNF